MGSEPRSRAQNSSECCKLSSATIIQLICGPAEALRRFQHPNESQHILLPLVILDGGRVAPAIFRHIICAAFCCRITAASVTSGTGFTGRRLGKSGHRWLFVVSVGNLA